MNVSSHIFTTAGAMLLVSLALDYIAKKIHFPRVSVLLIFGVIIGPSALNLVPDFIIEDWFPLVTDFALSMIAFLLGSKLTVEHLKKVGKYVFSISISAVIVTFLCVFWGLYLVGIPLPMALILAALSTATDPAATIDVVMESRKNNPFSKILLDIVAIDDAWCLIVFSLVIILLNFILGNQNGITETLLRVSWEIGGSIIIGILLGIPLAFLSGRIRPGQATLTEALGIVLFSCGVASLLEVSFFLTLMVMGAYIGQFAKHHTRAFHVIEGIEWPFLALFFIFAGATIHVADLLKIGYIGTAYIVFRIIGRMLGAWLGGTLVNAEPMLKKWMGAALMPQAGVSIGLGLIAINQFPEYSHQILPVVFGTTIMFEIFGPMITRKTLANT